MPINKRSDLKTESINKNSINIDSMSTYDILQTINNEDMIQINVKFLEFSSNPDIKEVIKLIIFIIKKFLIKII